MAKKRSSKRPTDAKPKKTSRRKKASTKAQANDDAAKGAIAENTQVGFAVVGVGASAGGLDAFRKFVAPIPSDCGMAFVLIQHLDPTHESRIAELLAAHTSLTVAEATDGMVVEPNHVYVIPPGAYLSVSGAVLRLSEPSVQRGARVPIDFFFRSLAEDQRQRAICVILSGTGSDGTLGLREVKAAGGMALAQDLATAQFDGMPRSAVATGLVDHVLPPEAMADMLIRYVGHSYVKGIAATETAMATVENRDDFSTILAILRTRIKYDFSCYKKGTLWRRVQRRMGLRHVENVADYAQVLRADSTEATALFKDLLIGVTRFFREPEAWLELRDRVIGPLVAGIGRATSDDAEKSGPLRIWVPGCATGEEAYTIAMLVIEEMQSTGVNQNVQIFASDIDHDALSFARAGVYPESIVADVSAERLRQFFIKGDHTYRINKELREAVVFAEQSLIGAPPFARLDLISCRNLLIYIEPESQQRIIAMFHFALREGGCLFLGNSETICGEFDLFETLSKKQRIYRRIGPRRLDKATFPIVAGQRGRTTSEPPAAPAAPAALLGASRLAQQLLLDRYSPACALVNRKFDVLYLHGPTDAYLLLPSGEPTNSLLAMAREGLRMRLRNVVREAIETGANASASARVRRGGKYQTVQLTAEPLARPHEADGLVLVAFDGDRAARSVDKPRDALAKTPSKSRTTGDRGAKSNRPTAGEPDAENDAASLAFRAEQADLLVVQLEDELRVAREETQALVEEMEATNEEMKAAHEEATSVNEELQSTNEELESSKEELQSLNEELTTVNSQLEGKMAELESTYNDLQNLLTSTDIATVFLDQRSRIKRFTPAATRLMRLIAADVGRPLSDVSLKFDDPDLSADVECVLARLAPIKKEVRAGDGEWYERRVLPYRTEDNHIDGVVVTLVDITARKLLHETTQRRNVELARQVEENAAQLANLDQILKIAVRGRDDAETAVHRGEEELQALFDLTAIGVAQFDATGRFVKVNPKFCAMLGYSHEEMLAKTFRDVTHADDHKADAAVATAAVAWLECVGDDASRGDASESYGADKTSAAIEKRFIGKEGEPVWALTRTTWIADALGKESTTIVAAIDLTELALEKQLTKISEEERQRLGRELHDTLGQQITAIGLVAARLHEQLQADASPRNAQAERLLEMIEEAQQQVRSLFRGLLPLELEGFGLASALAELADRTHALHEIDCRFECDEPIAIPDRIAAMHLYRIAQEAVHNAVKHSGARRIVVGLRFGAGVTLEIRDDGVGFSARGGGSTSDASERAKSSSAGLAIMRHRAKLIGGQLTIRSATPHGTIVECTSPIEPNPRR